MLGPSWPAREVGGAGEGARRRWRRRAVAGRGGGRRRARRRALAAAAAVKALCSKVTLACAGALTGAEARASAPAARAGVDAVSREQRDGRRLRRRRRDASGRRLRRAAPTPATRPEETAMIDAAAAERRGVVADAGGDAWSRGPSMGSTGADRHGERARSVTRQTSPYAYEVSCRVRVGEVTRPSRQRQWCDTPDRLHPKEPAGSSEAIRASAPKWVPRLCHAVFVRLRGGGRARRPPGGSPGGWERARSYPNGRASMSHLRHDTPTTVPRRNTHGPGSPRRREATVQATARRTSTARAVVTRTSSPGPLRTTRPAGPDARAATAGP